MQFWISTTSHGIFSQSLLKPFNNSWQGPLLGERSISGGLKRCPTILLRRPRPRLLQQHGNGRKNVESAAIFFCESNSVRKLFTLPASSSCSAQRHQVLVATLCVCMREIICGTAFQTWFTDFTPTFLFLKLSPLVLSKVSRSGILEEKRLPRWAISPKRDLCSLLQDVSSFTLSLRSYRTPKLPLYIREFCLRKNSIACETRHYYCIEIDSK